MIYFILLTPQAMRSATFGSWRMLTLGTEYSSWAQSPESLRQRQAVISENAEETDSINIDSSWQQMDVPQQYDAILHLDERAASGGSRGNHNIIRTHEALNSTPWSKSNR
jgi:hypothetical protein